MNNLLYIQSHHPYFFYGTVALGLLVSLRKIFSVLHFLYRNFLRPAKNLPLRYGPGSWAMVTGASDGIGLAFCKELSARGFGIVLVSRTQSKLEKIAKELKTPTRIIAVDFSKSYEEKFFDELDAKTSDLDVSILINNVGAATSCYFEEGDPKSFKDIVTINCFPEVMLSRKVLPRLLQRKHKSAIINLSSVAGVYPMPYISVYSATKAFNDFFSRAISQEYYGKVDIMSLRPNMVESNMSRAKRGLFVLSAEECAKGALDKLGYEEFTYGHWRHDLLSTIMHYVPASLIKQENRKIAEKVKRRNMSLKKDN